MAKMSKMETELKEWFDQYNYGNLKKVGLAGCMKSYYLGMEPKAISDDPSEIAEALGLNNYEWSTWEKIWYERSSWFNQ